MFEIPLFAILAILCEIRENSLIWSSLIWSHHCTANSGLVGLSGNYFDHFESEGRAICEYNFIL